MKLALFVPCFVDQLHPAAAVAAVRVLERLGLRVEAPDGAACCGQPPANAGFARDGEAALRRFERTYAGFDRVVVLSGSCAAHLTLHAPATAGRVTEFTAFLHDEVGLEALSALGAVFPRRVGLHIGCHGLRGLGLATPSEIVGSPRVDRLRAVLGTVRGVSFAAPRRPDECCGFGGTFAVAQPAVSARMGRDRLRAYAEAGAQALVSTDVSCLLHLGGLARRGGDALPMLHLAEVLAGEAPA